MFYYPKNDFFFHRYFQYGRVFVGLNQLDYEEFTRRDTLAIPENETVMKNPYVQKQEFIMFFFKNRDMYNGSILIDTTF